MESPSKKEITYMTVKRCRIENTINFGEVGLKERCSRGPNGVIFFWKIGVSPSR